MDKKYIPLILVIVLSFVIGAVVFMKRPSGPNSQQGTTNWLWNDDWGVPPVNPDQPSKPKPPGEDDKPEISPPDEPEIRPTPPPPPSPKPERRRIFRRNRQDAAPPPPLPDR